MAGTMRCSFPHTVFAVMISIAVLLVGCASAQESRQSQTPQEHTVSEESGDRSGKGEARELDYTVIASGTYSGIHKERRVVVHSVEEWRELWRELHSGSTEAAAAPGAPQIDFSRSTLVVYAAGERPTGGYAVNVVEVRRMGSRIEVAVEVSEPAPDAIVTQALTYPYVVVELPVPNAAVRIVQE